MSLFWILLVPAVGKWFAGHPSSPAGCRPGGHLHPYSPIVQINDRPLFRSPAVTRSWLGAYRFICKYPPEWSAAFSGSERKSLREAVVLIFRDGSGPR